MTPVIYALHAINALPDVHRPRNAFGLFVLSRSNSAPASSNSSFQA